MLTKLIIKQVIDSQRERLKKTDTGLPREITGFDDLSTHAFIVSGIRRCGKSTLLQQIYNTFNKTSIYINFEDPRLSGFDLNDFNRLHEIAESKKITTYFFDEIQLVPGWESFVRFRLDENYRIFISGSNSSMLSKELGTKLTGRHISRELFPFSYNEYLKFKNKSSGFKSFQEYLFSGGFPEFLKTKQAEVLMQHFNDIIIRDIAVRYNVKNIMLLKQLAVWLISNIGKPVTGNSLKKMFNIGSSASIMEYLSYFSDAYMFFFIPKFSYSQKVQLVNAKKVYCIDNGLVNTNSVSFNEDLGRFLENMVYMHLRHTNTEIYYFNEGKECDFVVFKNGAVNQIIQVCYQLDQNNFDREINGIVNALEFFNQDTGTIITSNQNDRFTIENKTIEVVPFYQYFL
ncbi:MAG: ATP-binding protein [Bacteroidales bacterium]|nr:ATP-binding protein [Bacteroidales bacterium]